MSPIRTPSQLEHELVLGVQRLAGMHGRVNLTQTEEAVGEVGRQSCDGAVQRIARAGVGVRVDRCQPRVGRFQGRFKAVHRDARWPGL